MTPRQREVLETIIAIMRETGRTPSIRDVGERLGLGNPNGVMAHINALRNQRKLAPSGKLRVIGFKLCPCCGQEVRRDAK